MHEKEAILVDYECTCEWHWADLEFLRLTNSFVFTFILSLFYGNFWTCKIVSNKQNTICPLFLDYIYNQIELYVLLTLTLNIWFEFRQSRFMVN